MTTKTSHLQTLAKAATFRVLSAVDTFVLSYLVTGKLGAAAGIVGFEVLTKSVLYYGHERLWTIGALANLFSGDASTS